MPIKKNVLYSLDKNKIKYEVLKHKKVYTAYDASQTLKVKPKEIAKSLIIKVKNDFIVAVLDADKNIDFKKIAKHYNVAEKSIKIPTEKVLLNKLKIKPGSAHVFGKLYKLPVILDKGLADLKQAIFSSGSFTESLKIKLKDYIENQEPEIFVFGVAKKIQKVKKKTVKSSQTRKKKKTTKKFKK